MKDITKSLDQFYTNPKVIGPLLKHLETKLTMAGYDIKDVNWLEPSAGSGNFVDALIERYGETAKIKAYDLDPKSNSKIEKANYLEKKITYSNKRVIVGNPPFGKRSILALEFLNKSMKESDVVAFILPNQFVRYLTQERVDSRFKLILQKKIEKDAFLVDDRKYNVNCVFQIWVNGEKESFKKFKDYRKKQKPQVVHPDFDLMIHNNTEQTKKYFNKKLYGWTFAMHRQGYYDFDEIILSENEIIPKRQYLFVKCNIDKSTCLKIAKEMDKKKMIEWSTSVPGFSNEDFIREYKLAKKRIVNKNEK